MTRDVWPSSVSAKFAVRTALLGFSVAVLLAFLAYYETSGSDHGRHINDWVFLALCPPSIAALGLENASAIGGLMAWLQIALMNAGLYAAVGWLLGKLIGRRGSA
jgi:hypothetical protein